MNNNIWIDKYQPNKLSDIYGNQDTISNIITWLLNFPKYRKEMRKIYKKNNIDSSDNIKIIKNKISKRIRKTRTRKNQTNKKFSNILVTGNHGIGKTIIINVIF